MEAAMSQDVQKGDQAHAHGFKIFINDVEHTVVDHALSGLQIKALGGIQSDYQLFLEKPGDDQPIQDTDSIKIHSNMRFYSLPPATYGSR
jgi:hypothetical protein